MDEKEVKRQRVREHAADPTVYETRLGYRGARSRWSDQAMEAVHEGTINALTTDALPEKPTLAWWYQIDKNAARDLRRKEAREHGAQAILEGLRAPIERPDQRLEVQDEQAAARRTLEDLRLRAGVDETTFDLLRRYWVARESTRQLAAEAGVTHQAIGNRITRAMNKIQDAARTGIDRVQEAFRKAFGDAE